MRNRILRVAAVLFFLTGVVLAQSTPQLINYQGRLTDPSGLPVTGPVDLTFRFYDSLSGGNLLLTDSQTGVQVDNGIYHVLLGSGTLAVGTESTLAGVFQNRAAVYLSVEVGSDGEMDPRAQIASVPFALKVDGRWLTSVIADSDFDGDTYDKSTDCDDTDASIYPGATDVCDDGIDQNCDGSDTNRTQTGVALTPSPDTSVNDTDGSSSDTTVSFTATRDFSCAPMTEPLALSSSNFSILVNSPSGGDTLSPADTYVAPPSVSGIEQATVEVQDNSFTDQVVINITDDEMPAALIPDTALTDCYNDTVLIACPSPGGTFYGQDAQFGPNAMDFTDNGNGTITDNTTGLMWWQDGTISSINYGEAVTACDGSTRATYTDWRLPEYKELRSIADHSRTTPAVDPLFNLTSLSHWTSTTYAGAAGQHWIIYYNSGTSNHVPDTQNEPVLCVRGSAWGAGTFQDNGTTISDLVFNLEWQKDDDNVTRGWQGALSYCETLTLDGDTDWRLPNIKELTTLLDFGNNNPTIDTTYFPNTDNANYWSSTTYAGNFGTGWRTDFGDGITSGMDKDAGAAYVRCVREMP